VNHFRPALLQLFDDLHARQQPFFLALETVDLLDALLELNDLVSKALVATFLIVDHLGVGEHRQQDGADSKDDRAGCGDAKFALAPLSIFFAPRE
jgi:hypothetical protein